MDNSNCCLVSGYKLCWDTAVLEDLILSDFCDDFCPHSVRTELWHTKRIMNFFILIHTRAALPGLLELHSTRTTRKAQQSTRASLILQQAFQRPFSSHGSHGNAIFQFCFLVWLRLHGSLLKGADFCLLIWWIFMALPYYASRGFPTFELIFRLNAFNVSPWSTISRSLTVT